MEHRAVLIRDESTDHGTRGVLTACALTLHVMEPPDRDNRRNRSCFPAGTYEVRPHRSPRFSASEEDDELPESRAPALGATGPPLTTPARARDAGGEHPRATAAAKDEADPLPALVARAEEELGPLVDGWSDEVLRELEDASSFEEAGGRLDTLLAWTEAPNEPTPDVAATAAALGPALVAAHLAGRYDVEEQVASATASFFHRQSSL